MKVKFEVSYESDIIDNVFELNH